jgi:hypothetical protein
LGVITNCNLAFGRLFGYTKKDLVGSNVKTLMPEMLAIHHDAFVQRNLERTKISRCAASSQEIVSVGQDRAKYIFPLAIKLVCVPNLLNEMQYIAKVRCDKKMTSGRVCYLLLNPQKRVTALSSTCIDWLNLSHATLSDFTLDMAVLAPALFDRSLPFGGSPKAGALIQIYHPPSNELRISIYHPISRRRSPPRTR